MTKVHTVNLESNKAFKFNAILETVGGGRYSFSERLSKTYNVAGLTYLEGLEIPKATNNYQCVFEKVKSGLVVYLRANLNSYAMLIPYSEIKEISLVKSPDIINPQNISFFTLLSKMSSSYLWTRNFLNDNEICILKPIVLTLKTKEFKDVKFEITAFNPNKVVRFLSEFENIKTNINILHYEKR